MHAVAQHPGPDPLANACGPPGADVPEQRHQREHGEEVDPGPLGAAAQPEADAGGQPVRPQPSPGPNPSGRARPVAAAAAVDLGRERGPRAVAVDQEEPERGQGPEHHEDVEQPGRGCARTPRRRRPAAARRCSRAGSSRTAAARSGRSSGWPGCRRPRWRTASRTELSIPNSCSPKPIIHLPTGGCTTESPYVVKTFGVPRVNSASGVFRLGRLARSMPYFQIE